MPKKPSRKDSAAAIVRDLAEYGDGLTAGCAMCDRWKGRHKAGCLWTRARALMAASKKKGGRRG